jgi:hypothetical protein
MQFTSSLRYVYVATSTSRLPTHLHNYLWRMWESNLKHTGVKVREDSGTSLLPSPSLSSDSREGIKLNYITLIVLVLNGSVKLVGV